MRETDVKAELCVKVNLDFLFLVFDYISSKSRC